MQEKRKRHPIKDNFRQFVIDEAKRSALGRNATRDHRNDPAEMYELAHGVIVVNLLSGYFDVYVNTNQWSLGKFQRAKNTSRDGRKWFDGSDLLHSPRNCRPDTIADVLKILMSARHLCTWHDKPQYFNF